MSKDNIVRGRFSQKEDEFIRSNYLTMTDAQIAEALGRSLKSIQNRRVKLDLTGKNEKKLDVPQSSQLRRQYVNTLDEDDKAKFHLSELRQSSTFRQLKNVLTKDEVKYYEDKYVEFRMDPSIETLTSMEKDAWHEMVMAQVRIFRLMAEEKADPKISKAREIRDSQDVVQKCQESLNVQRKQRLKGSNDQAINFTSLIKELKDPRIRREVGYEAAMLKFMAEQFYNDHLSDTTAGNIVAGRRDAFDVSRIFKDGVQPSGLSSEFA